MRNWLWGLLFSSVAWGTTCYTNCEDRFPKWYQAPDRARCNVEKANACLKPSGLPGGQDLHEFDRAYGQMTSRLLSGFLEGGYVVSRDRRQEPMHQGDSLLWTTLAMASLPCAQASPILEALTRSIERHDGRILRFEPLPDSYRGNETSRDAEVGALYGFATLSQRCPQYRDSLARAWGRHREFVESHDGRLHEGSNPNFYMNPGLKFVWDLVSHHLLGSARPSSESLHFFEAAVTLSSTTIRNQKSACYPNHLSTLLLTTAAKLDMPVNHLTRREFCHQTRDLDLPLTEWYCERGEGRAFLANYQVNQWEYRHQRCPSWESPDVDAGDSSPGVDYLVYYSLLSSPQ